MFVCGISHTLESLIEDLHVLISAVQATIVQGTRLALLQCIEAQDYISWFARPPRRQVKYDL